MTIFGTMRRTVAAVLISVIGLAMTAASEAPHGGEGDWPFFCTLDNYGPYDGFRLETRANSPTGYVLWFYANGRSVSGIYPNVAETDDGKFFQVYGYEHIGIFRDRHLLAYVKKQPSIETRLNDSMSSLETTLRGTTPAEFEMEWSTCSTVEP